MLKLFKYEIRKTMIAKWIILGITVALEGLFMYGCFAKNANTASIACVLLLLDALFGILFMGIRSVVTLHNDMNTKQGYMLFMTPHSNYAILGAKALECMVSIILAGAFFFVVGILDLQFMISRFGDVKSLMQIVGDVLKMAGIDIGLTTGQVACIVVRTAATWFETVILAFFADVMACALLRGKKGAGFVSFLFYMVLSYASNQLIGFVPTVGDLYTTMLVGAAVMLVLATAMYIATATIMEKKLSV